MVNHDVSCEACHQNHPAGNACLPKVSAGRDVTSCLDGHGIHDADIYHPSIRGPTRQQLKEASGSIAVALEVPFPLLFAESYVCAQRKERVLDRDFCAQLAVLDSGNVELAILIFYLDGELEGWARELA